MIETLTQIDLTKIPLQEELIYDKTPVILASGGYRSGKTYGLLIKFVLLMQLEKNRGFIGRLDGKDLKLTTMRDLFSILPKSWISSKNDQLGIIKLVNGSEIVYGDLKDLDGKRGLTLGVFMIDQAEEVSEEVFTFFRARLAYPVSRHYALLSCNPDRSSWLYRKFIDKDTRDPKFKVYHMNPVNNPFLPKTYVSDLLESGLPDHWISRYINGEWTAVENQVYPDFNIETHVLSPFDVPPEWFLYESIDIGLSVPTSYHLYGIEFDRNCFAVNEFYDIATVNEVCSFIKSSRPGIPKTTYMDPAAFAKNQAHSSGKNSSIADIYRENDIYPCPYRNDWPSGYQRVTAHLAIDPTHKHPLTGRLGAPHLYVFDTCPKMISEFIGYQWKKVRSTVTGEKEFTDEPVGDNDHAMDELRGFLNMKPQVAKVKAPIEQNPLYERDMADDRYSYMLA